MADQGTPYPTVAGNRLAAIADERIGRFLSRAGNLDLLFRNRTFLLLDLFGWAVIPWAALALRLDGLAGAAAYAHRATLYTLWAIGFQFLGLYLAGMYRRMWRYASLAEMFSISAVLGLAGVAAALAERLVSALLLAPGAGESLLPRSIPIISVLLAVMWSGGTRFTLRYASQVARRGRRRGERTLILGAGDAGSALVRELQSSAAFELEPVGFIDDDPATHGQVIHGIPVLGGRQAIAWLARTHRVGTAIIAMPTASGVVIRELRALCVAAELRVLTVPGLQALLTGKVTVSHLRQVQIEDLLRREPVHTDEEGVRQLLAGMTVLVTGAGGSIGSELCRQIARLGVPELVLLGHGENSIFAIENELRAQYPALRLSAVIADVRDPARIDAVFARFRPGAVFHAAAHKHVPLMETNPEEAVTNNVGGTHTVLQAAERWEVPHFVLVSTDKAVNPGNVMGATKRLAEELVRVTALRTGRSYLSVRFGNVLGSRGSVVPTFQAQILAGGPVYVTDPEVTRYFMTIPEAVQLVLQAAALGQGGETFVLDMGEPVKIVDLARDLIELSGLEVEQDIRIEFTGLRPGDKLFEELFLDSEHHGRTAHQKIFVAPAGPGTGLAAHELQVLIHAAQTGDRERMLELLSELVAAVEERNGGSAPAPDDVAPRDTRVISGGAATHR